MKMNEKLKSQDYIIASGLRDYNFKNGTNRKLKDNHIFVGYENPLLLKK